TPEGSDGGARKAQTPTKASRAGFFILRGGLKDRSHARALVRWGCLTPPRPTRSPGGLGVPDSL
ncbi:MAG: hypothetical protein ACK5W5_05485, partial [Cyanobacteriota bacterium]